MPSSPVVRFARNDEYVELCLLFTEFDEFHRMVKPNTFHAVTGPRRTKEFIDVTIQGPDSTILVVDGTEGELLGLAALFVRTRPATIVINERRIVELDSLVVRDKTRRKGVARSLLAAANDWALNQNVSVVELNIWSFNIAAKALYKSVGFETITERMSLNIS